ncbi:MAG: hypothetical protein R2769_07425 [Saprospiraceae bacterium]
MGASSTFSALGLMNMGTSYGIDFKYSATALADPYAGGTTFASVSNAGLTAGELKQLLLALVPAGNWFGMLYWHQLHKILLSSIGSDELCS